MGAVFLYRQHHSKGEKLLLNMPACLIWLPPDLSVNATVRSNFPLDQPFVSQNLLSDMHLVTLMAVLHVSLMSE